MMNSLRERFGVIAAAVGFSVLVVWLIGGFSQYQPPPPPTQDEQRQELVALLTDGALNEAVEKSGGIASFLGDGGYDSSLLLAELSGTSTVAEMQKYTRQVSMRISQFMNEDEVKGFLETDELPQEVLDSFQDGYVQVPLLEEIVLGVLTGDSVLISLYHLHLADIPSTLANRVFIEAVLLPDASIEDTWMSEGLFNGSIVDLATSEEHKPYLDYGLVALKRPEEKLVAIPEDYSYERAAQEGVEPLQRVVYLRPIRGIVSFGFGNVANTDADQGLFTIQGQFLAPDLGAPVFVLKDGAVQWAGVIINITNQGDTATVLGAESLKAREAREEK